MRKQTNHIEIVGKKEGMVQKEFLSDFINISSYQTIVYLAILFVCFIGIRFSEKKKVKFSKRMLIGTLAGLCLGLLVQLIAGFPEKPLEIHWVKEVSAWYSFVGNGYMDFLKMLVIPLVFISILRVIMNMEEDNVGTIAGKAIGMLVGTTLIAAIIGSVLAFVFQVGNGIQTEGTEASISEMKSILVTIRGLFPSNIVKSMAEGNVISVVIFASFIGVAIRRQKKKYEDIILPFMKWVEASYKIILSVAMTIIKFMPYGMIALLSNTIISQGVHVLVSVSKFIFVLYLGMILMFFVHMLIAWTKGVKPSRFLKGGFKPLMLAFTSRSSLGTLPVLIETLSEEFEVEEGIASFVGSLGSNMGMNGCAGIYPAMVAVMLAQITGTPMDMGFFIMLAIVIVVSSFGIAGIPGAATLSVSVVISGMGMGEFFPLIGAIIAVDPILDMGRTCLNVSGTMVSAIVTGKEK